mmetsp:Transcript_27046/g.38111  ORF Transcript_27046/g.38111 Transcript_27046/m.38111 type:complete len:117 (-) Transcript_27046:143-493(-)
MSRHPPRTQKATLEEIHISLLPFLRAREDEAIAFYGRNGCGDEFKQLTECMKVHNYAHPDSSNYVRVSSEEKKFEISMAATKKCQPPAKQLGSCLEKAATVLLEKKREREKALQND